MQSPGATESFAEARRWLQRGDYLEAEKHCTEAVSKDASHHDALHLLGVIHARTGRPESGIAYIDRALAVQPRNARTHNSRGNMLLELGQPQAALDEFDTAIGLLHGFAIAHSNRASALLALGHAERALAAADDAIALDPRYPPAHNNRGSALMELERHAEALQSLERALALAPDFVEALTTRGNALMALHRPHEALEVLERALQVNPRFYKARVNLCQALLDLARVEEALAVIDAALQEQPLDPKALLSKARVLFALGRPGEAAAVGLGFLEHAVAALPDNPDLLSMLGAAQIRVGQVARGIDTFERLLALDADYDYAIGGLLQAKMHECDWRDLDATMSKALDAVRRDRRAVMPFILTSIPSTPADQQQAARIFCSQVMPPVRPREAPRGTVAGRRFRIGYVSGDFREHPVANQLAGLLERHDRSRFEIVGVALEPADLSVVGRRVRGAWDDYLDVPKLDAIATAEQIRALDLDVAIDLSGSTLGNRINLYAYRLAPVQVNFLGYPGTLASGCHDYILADPHVIPPGHERFYDEKVVRLPHSYQPYDSSAAPPACAASRRDEGLPDNAFVYCCFNNRFKYNPRMFDIWMRVLGRVSDSVLWLVSCPADAQQNLRREAAARGIDPQRLVFAQRKDLRSEHIARYALADLFLDTQPFNAHATASDALWAGLPVLACLGESFPGRVAAGMLKSVALPELIAGSLVEYESMAVDLAKPGSFLADARERLARTRMSQPLFDLDRYRRDLESALERMIAISRRGGAPEAFDVTG